MIGLCALLVISVACFVANISAKTLSLDRKGFLRRPNGRPGTVALNGRGVRRTLAVMSLGRSTKMRPRRPEVAILNTSLILRGSSAVSLAMTFYIVQLLTISMTSAFWKADLIAEVET